ncbi:hypothetical protein HPB49_006027 [Dermacentor silvarum]|uniref:Uncharacterized protein n=1 Tax=Dermacentor silvarum TaxID=543639 RepID=A0ACB8C7M9_DERSI|nr:hypothetical protein HPB49_006027 [Dermacentor silvarum]
MRTIVHPACPWLVLALLVSEAALGARVGGKPGGLDLSDLWKRGPLSLRSRAAPMPSLSMHNRDHMPVALHRLAAGRAAGQNDAGHHRAQHQEQDPGQRQDPQGPGKAQRAARQPATAQ